MNSRFRIGCLHLLVAAAFLALPSARALAGSFPVVGGSYSANVALRLDSSAHQLSSVTGVRTNCSVQGGSAADVVDGSMATWALQGVQDSNASATVTLTLDKVYQLNKLVTQYGPGLGVPPGTYELRLSADGSSWTTCVPRKAITAQGHTDTFPATDAKYVAWQAWGPGSDISGTKYLYMMEMMAFAASTSPQAPQKDEGYSIGHTGSLLSKSGWTSWAQPENVIDNNLLNYAIASPAGTCILDLGAPLILYHIRAPFYSGQNWANSGKIEIGADTNTWTTIVNQTPFSGGNFSFSPQKARYVRLSGDGGGAMLELEVFALPPPPGTIINAK